MNLIKTTTFAIAFAFTLLASGQQAKPLFTDESASKFIAGQTDLKEKADEFKKTALTAYAKNDFLEAAENLRVSKILSIISASGSKLPNALKSYMLSDSDFRREFLDILSDKDEIANVLGILGALWENSPEKFKAFKSLAIAISVVFDTQPPESWPHSQVSTTVLPRALPDPVKSFNYWISMRECGRLLMQPEKLSAEELKFLVSSISSDEDKEWVQSSIQVNISNISKLYQSIKYDSPRLSRNAYTWEYSDYSLKTIKEKGGICTDQSYYTCEVAKARGVPAFILSGAGADGFHAWVAYMERNGKWNFNVGRYESSRFVTGRTIDPQTWYLASDHSLKSMSERFRGGKKYQANEIFTMFAKEFFSDGEYEKCIAACNMANSQDSRNVETWNLLIEALEKSNAVETKIREAYIAAMRSFSRYPDTDIIFRRALIKRLDAAGEESESEKLSSSIIIKTKGSRPDIAMEFARSSLEGEIARGETEKFYSSYKRLISMFKSDGAMAFSGITIPILNSLIAAEKKDEAKQTMAISRSVLKPSKNSTLESNMRSVENQINSL